MADYDNEIGGGVVRRTLSVFLPLAMAAAALFMTAPAASAAAVHPGAQACYGPSCGRGQVSVSVSYGANGVITLTISGSGMKPGESVQIIVTLPSRSVGVFTANGNGDFGGPVSLPAGYARGTHGLEAVGTVSGTTASSTFYLSQASGTLHPCTASVSSVRSSGVVLAAAYLSATCKSAAPAAALPGSAGGNPSAVGTASSAHTSQLPFTGSNASTYAAVGALAIGAGGALVLVSRRRRRAAWK